MRTLSSKDLTDAVFESLSSNMNMAKYLDIRVEKSLKSPLRISTTNLENAFG